MKQSRGPDLTNEHENLNLTRNLNLNRFFRLRLGLRLRLRLRNLFMNEKGEGSFTVLMTSLSIILLAFFILLNSISVMDDRKIREAFGSLIGAFHILPGGLVAIKGQGDKLSLPSIPIRERESFLYSLVNRFENKIYSDGLGEYISVISSKRGLVITLASGVVFESGSAEVAEHGKRLLKDVAVLIKKVPNFVEIEGHTDSVPINTSQYPSNWELSIDRAANTLQYFVKDEEITPERFSMGGYADSKPLFKDSEYAALNRRIEITLLNKRQL